MIKAVILAAGSGTRLRDLISNKPKCMVHVNGMPIIAWQLRAIEKAGVKRIGVVTGYRSELLRHYISEEFPDLDVTFIENKDYSSTNNMYSLLLAREFVGEGAMLFMNADVAIVPEIVARIVQRNVTCVGVDIGSYNEESMKVIAKPEDGTLIAISKAISQEQSLGSSIDLYSLQPLDAAKLFDECAHIVNVEQQRNQWSEVALHRLLESGRLRMLPVDVAGLDWYEVDNSSDLAHAELLFTASALIRQPPKAYFIDLDGTIYIGNTPIDGAADFVHLVRSMGARVVFLSNNSSKSHADYVSKLNSLGIAVEQKDVLLSTDALGAHLQAVGIKRAFVLGTSRMKDVLEQYGVKHQESDPDAVLLGYHNEVVYQELAKASRLLHDKSIPYFASHLDNVCPTEDGPIPDAGALIELLATTTSRRPERAFGKPSSQLITSRMQEMGVTPMDIAVVGDRVYTDLALAHAVGARFVGVLSGEMGRKDLESYKDVMTVPSLGHLAKAMKRSHR